MTKTDFTHLLRALMNIPSYGQSFEGEKMELYNNI